MFNNIYHLLVPADPPILAKMTLLSPIKIANQLRSLTRRLKLRFNCINGFIRQLKRTSHLPRIWRSPSGRGDVISMRKERENDSLRNQRGIRGLETD
jgi:hypothetical protein